MSADSVAQDQIKAFVDRILRMKEEAKSINADIREIYAEAKGNGFDKTVLGKLVSYVEKRNADSNAVAEGEALFDLYLTAYYGAGTIVATHTHAPEPRPSPEAAQAAPHPARRTTSSVENEAAAFSTPHPEAKTSADGGTTEQGLESPADSVAGEVSRASDGAGSVAPIQPETAVQSAEPVRASATDGGQELSVSSAPVGAIESEDSASDAGQAPSNNTTLSFAEKIKRLRPLCQRPEACRSSGGKDHCWICRKAANGEAAA